MVRYRTVGGRSSRQREQSFGDDRREAGNFALKVAESPCTGIQLPGVVLSADLIIPAHAQIEAVAAGLPPDGAATMWLMHGCGLRIGEAAVRPCGWRASDCDYPLGRLRRFQGTPM